jgi:O-antigen/teichoic acid export membrane protein
MDMQKNAFKVTSISATTNIVLNAILIPMIGILGAAIATSVTIAVNAILAHRVLSKAIVIKLRYDCFYNILKASLAMAFIVGGYRLLVPLSNIWLTLIPVALGGIVYGALVLKFDEDIYREIKGIMMQFERQ